jgi:DNA-binding CsgD family transcriptional regulator
MGGVDAIQRAARTVANAGGHASDADFADETLASVATVLPHDGYALFGVDPLSGLRTFQLSRHGLDGMSGRLAHNETSEPDVNRYAELARRSLPAGILGGSAREPSSPRLHDILRPAGFGSERRLALRTDRGWWGALSLFRERARRPFDADDALLAATRLGPALTSAVRKRPLRRLQSRPRPPGSGVVLPDPNNTIVSTSEEAQGWLQALCAGGSDEMTVDDILRVVYEVAHATRTRGLPDLSMCRIRMSSGAWVALQGNRVDVGSADIAVILQPAGLTELLPAVDAWLGLTPREAQVLLLVANGLPGKHIAARLALSPQTVNTHLRSIYRKANVTGRAELLGQLT